MANDAGVTPQPPYETRKKRAFVISPIGAPGTEVHRRAYQALKYIFKRALPPEEWIVHRADEGMIPDSINQHVIESIYEADLIIADLTGHNPNVFYELAVAHGISKPVVHLISEGEALPFDIIDQRTIFYDINDLDSVEKTVSTLVNYAEAALSSGEPLRTPLSRYGQFNQIRSAQDGAESTDAVASLLEEVLSRLSRLENQIVRRSSRSDVSQGLLAETLPSLEIKTYAAGDYIGSLGKPISGQLTIDADMHGKSKRTGDPDKSQDASSEPA